MEFESNLNLVRFVFPEDHSAAMQSGARLDKDTSWETGTKVQMGKVKGLQNWLSREEEIEGWSGIQNTSPIHTGLVVFMASEKGGTQGHPQGV